MANQDIKIEIKESGIKMWQIADKLGVSDMTLSRKFRYELTVEEKKTIRDIISTMQREPAYQKQSFIKQEA